MAENFMTGNVATIIGTLVENKLGKMVTKDGRNMINGYIVTSDGTSRIRIDCIAMELGKEGKANPSYRDLEKLLTEGVPEDSANNITGSIIKISSGENTQNGRIENADYLDQSGALATNVKITASFPRIVSRLADNEKMGSTFSFTGYIEAINEEIKNDEATGRLNVKLIGINYDTSTNPINIIVPKEVAAGFQAAHQVGQTATIDGVIINIMESRTIQTQVAWGTPQEKVQTTIVREFIATGGSGPFVDNDPGNVTVEHLKVGAAKRETKLQDAKTKSDASAAAKKTQAGAATGFAGNASAFTAATQAGGVARPSF